MTTDLEREHRSEARPADSLIALMSNVIDYAGLFPPAKLDMEPTVENYAAYIQSPHAWMLERLVVPVARLDEFESCAAGHLPTGADDEPWPITALTAPAGDDGFADDVARIAAFNADHASPEGGRALIDVIELRAGTSDAIDRALDSLTDDLYPFFELPVADDPRGLLAALVGGEAGAKIRTGGITADMHPDPAHVARFIAGCARADVPFKATAGLHHPLRHRAADVGAKQFGFLNVFVAAALALHRELDEPTIARVLEEESIDAFRFETGSLAWRDLTVATDDVEDARLTFAVSFGSCSFVEPREDLEQLGLL
jgi:hypothetical protein